MKIALFQSRITDNISENLQRTLSAIQTAAFQGAELIIFPEIHLTPFFPSRSGENAEKYLMTADGMEITAICDACRKNKIAASPNIYINETNGKYDASFMINSDGNIMGISKMVHVSSFPGFYESEYYTPSDGGFEVYELPVKDGICRVGIVICFDRHFPESIRTCSVKNADIIIIPTANTIGEPDEMFLWELRVQAMQNSVAVAMCNRVGESCGQIFSGRSTVIDCAGNVVTYADEKENLIIADIDYKQSAVQRASMPYFSARRTDKYL